MGTSFLRHSKEQRADPLILLCLLWKGSFYRRTGIANKWPSCNYKSCVFWLWEEKPIFINKCLLLCPCLVCLPVATPKGDGKGRGWLSGTVNGALGWHHKGQCQQQESRIWSAGPFYLEIESPNKVFSFIPWSQWIEFSLPSPIFEVINLHFFWPWEDQVECNWSVMWEWESSLDLGRTCSVWRGHAAAVGHWSTWCCPCVWSDEWEFSP